MLGYASPVGVAGLAEFRATDVCDRRREDAVWTITWPRVGPVVDPNARRDGITVPLNDATSARMDDGFEGRELGTAATPTIVPAASQGAFCIVRGDESTLHRDWDDFVVDLSALLTGGAHPLRLTAIGGDDAATDRLTATSVTCVLR